MEIINISDKNMEISGGVDISEKLQHLFDTINGDTLINLAAGVYYISNQLKIENWYNVRFVGYGAKIVTHFDPCEPESYKGAFKITGCKECSFSGFTITTDNAPNVLAKVLKIDKEKLTADLELQKGARLNGNEKFVGFNSLDDDMSPNGHVWFADNNGYRWHYLRDNVIRLFAYPSTGVQLRDLEIGEYMCMRHSLYAQCPLEFTGCSDIEIKDVTINSSPGLACAIYPDSKNFSFVRYRVLSDKKSPQIFSSNADGIHITGLRGKLTVKNCLFENLGDDALNIHNQGATVYGIDGNVIHCYAKRFKSTPQSEDGRLSLYWAAPGDRIKIYEKGTFRVKGEFTVLEYTVNKIVTDKPVSGLEEGDYLANTAYFADTEITGCTVINTRARAFLIETGVTTVEDCHFYGIVDAALLIGPDMGVWNEMCPVEKLIIRGNVFDKCGCGSGKKKCGGILLTANDKGDEITHFPTGLHGEVTVENNVFVNMKDTLIFAQSVQKLILKDNCITEGTDFVYEPVMTMDCGEVIRK